MSTLAILETPDPEVQPGTETQCAITVRNAGSVVESYHLDVLGPASGWTNVDPPDLTVFPGTEGHAMVTFRPPRATHAKAGPVPYAIRVMPSEHPETTSVPEGTATLMPFAETTGEITPHTSRGRRSGVHHVAIDNRGNSPLTIGLSAVDPDGALDFAIRPLGEVLPPGRTMLATVVARHRGLLWRGQPISRPFQVLAATGEGQTPVMLEASAVQAPIFSKALLRLLLMLLALAVALAALWLFVLRPVVESTARDAVAAPVAAAKKEATAAKQDAAAAGAKADQAAKAAGTGANGAGTGSGSGAAAATTPSRQRLATVTALNATNTSAITVPAKTTLSITDLVLQNPQGDLGRVDLIVAGDTLLTLSLNNFRDIDYHYVEALQVPAGKKVELKVVCQKPGPVLAGESGSACREFASITGTTRKS